MVGNLGERFGNFWPGGSGFLALRGGGVKRFDHQGGGMKGETFLSAAFGGHFLMFPPKKHVFSYIFCKISKILAVCGGQGVNSGI